MSFSFPPEPADGIEVFEPEAERVDQVVQSTGTVYRNPTLSLVRRRHVGDGMQEYLELSNQGADTLSLELSLLFDADFADIFEIKDHLQKAGRVTRHVGDGEVTIRYQRDGFHRETTIRAAGAFLTEER